MLDRLTVERMLTTAGEAPILVALSGGGDSVALLHMLTELFGVERIQAAIVDHGLRVGSAEDAQRAAGYTAYLGVATKILTLSWPGDANRGQQAARTARYVALCNHARDIGAPVIAVGHTADDQAETVLMRAANGSGWRGLAGIAPFAPAPIWPEGRGLFIARPLLGARRLELRIGLASRGRQWLEDPANANPRFERVRTRERLSELEQAGFDPMRLVKLASALRQRADHVDAAASELIARAAGVHGGSVYIKREAWPAAREVRWRALALLMAAVSGAAREPSSKLLPEIDRRMMFRDAMSFTHSGVSFCPAVEDAGVWLMRDVGGALGRKDGAPPPASVDLTPDQAAVYDGRLAAIALEPGWRVVPHSCPDLIGLEKDGNVYSIHRNEAVVTRWLAADRIAHTLAGTINATPQP